MNLKDTFRYLIKIAGKILFVSGLVLNVLMLFFGFWPSFIYILIMLFGAGLISINRNVKGPKFNLPSLNKLKIPFHFNRANNFYNQLGSYIMLILIAIIGSSIILLAIFIATSDYSKKVQTQQEMNEIKSTLAGYYKKHQFFPKSLPEIIGNNPMRSTWLKDFWGNNYYYQVTITGKSFSFVSSGKDGTFFTKDDLVLNY